MIAGIEAGEVNCKMEELWREEALYIPLVAALLCPLAPRDKKYDELMSFRAA